MFKVSGYKSYHQPINCHTFDTCAHRFIKTAVTNQQEHIIPEHTPISDQGQLSSCVANSVADALEILRGLESPDNVQQVSRLFIYYDARNYSNDVDKDEGCYIHFALESLKALGVCRESVWSYDESKVLFKPTLEAYTEANSNTITEFYQITSRGAKQLDDIETAIRANHPVIFGVQVSSEFQNYTGGNKVFNVPSRSIGGHAMILTGVRFNDIGQREFLCRNSWGSSWGINGHAWLSSFYVNTLTEAFVPTRMPNFVI